MKTHYSSLQERTNNVFFMDHANLDDRHQVAGMINAILLITTRI